MSVQGAATPRGQGPRVLVVVPTTGGPLLLRRLAPRPGLPHPAAFAEGDYRPLALSADYRALAGPEGPVARRLGRPVPPHELRLSGEPDGGRSWEAPVALAHLLLAGGAELAADPEGATLLLWATGSLDLDLRLLPGDYALARKVEASRSPLEAAGDRRTLAVLPPGPGRDEARAALAALRRAVPVAVVPAGSLGDVRARLGDDPSGAGAASPAPRRARPLHWGATGVAAAWLLWPLADRREDADDVALVASVEAARDLCEGEAPPAGPAAPEGAVPAGPEPSPADLASEPPAPEPSPSESSAPEPSSLVPLAPEADPSGPRGPTRPLPRP